MVERDQIKKKRRKIMDMVYFGGFFEASDETLAALRVAGATWQEVEEGDFRGNLDCLEIPEEALRQFHVSEGSPSEKMVVSLA